MKRVTIRTTFDNISKVMPDYSEMVIGKYESNLLITGAKAYYRGGGWWVISGYAADGMDVDKIIYILKG
jgi:hypothetical protein